MEYNNIGLFIGSFILILVGVVFINSISDSISELDDIVWEHNETFTWVNNTEYQLSHDGIVSGSELVWNSTGITLTTADYTLGDDYIKIVNDSGTDIISPALNISYDYQGDNYVGNSTARTLMNLAPLFFAITIMIIGFIIVRKGFNI